jgi:hypothetical protein
MMPWGFGSRGFLQDSGGSLPGNVTEVIWAAGGSVTTSLASLFATSQITVVAGQAFMFQFQAVITNGGTAGFDIISIQKASGDTAVVNFGKAGTGTTTAFQQQANYAISEVKTMSGLCIGVITTGGTFTPSMFGQASGAAGTVATNGAYLSCYRIW